MHLRTTGLHPEKLVPNIIRNFRQKHIGYLGIWGNEVGYQADTIGKFGLDFDGNQFFILKPPNTTDCLAKDHMRSSCRKTEKQLSRTYRNDKLILAAQALELLNKTKPIWALIPA